MLNTPFHLSQADSRPMYQQIMDGIKQCIVTGQWPAGFALPSIRELSSVLKVSVITVKRAYQELEREGVIITRQGMGSFVGDQSSLNGQKEAELDDHLERAIAIAKLLDLSPSALKKRLAALLEQS